MLLGKKGSRKSSNGSSRVISARSVAYQLPGAIYFSLCQPVSGKRHMHPPDWLHPDTLPSLPLRLRSPGSPLATDAVGRRELRSVLAKLTGKINALAANDSYMSRHFDAVGVKANRDDIAVDESNTPQCPS